MEKKITEASPPSQKRRFYSVSPTFIFLSIIFLETVLLLRFYLTSILLEPKTESLDLPVSRPSNQSQQSNESTPSAALDREFTIPNNQTEKQYTYTDETAGFSITLPNNPDLVVIPQDDGIEVKENLSLRVDAPRESYSQATRELFFVRNDYKPFPQHSSDFYKETVSKTTVDGEQAEKHFFDFLTDYGMKRKGDKETIIFLNHNGKPWGFILKKNDPGSVTLFYQALASFKFLDEARDISNWKTFNDDRLGFSFKYPNDWEMGSGALGCGPIFGPKAKEVPLDPTASPMARPLDVFPYISVCRYGYSLPNPVNLDEAVKQYSGFGKVISRSVGKVDGHDYVKVLKDWGNPVDGDIGAIIIDLSSSDAKKNFSLEILISYDSKVYKTYGTQENFSVQNYLKIVDQIVSTFKFAK